MEGNEKSSLLGKATHVGERLVEVGGEAARLKTAASHAVEDAVTEAKRLAKRIRYAAEDLMENAAHRDNLMPNINELPPDTGHYAASQRAAHQILDNPKIFEDPLALRIIGAEAESKLRLGLAQFQKPTERDLRALMVVRNRYAEDELARSIQRGVRQYVILGAGLDTFAYRNSFPLLRVFEVDHPATQEGKRSYLKKAAIPIPASVTFVSVDFERQMMIDALRQSGFKSDELTFISWLGVVRYLTREAFISVLTSIISSMGVGSEVVLNFSLPPSLLQRLRQLPHRTIANWTFKNNEFRPTYYDPAWLKCDLKRIGFADVQLFAPTEMNVRYCNDRTDGLRVPTNFCLLKARV
jgi:methyltransferase (TIGR00027 family)